MKSHILSVLAVFSVIGCNAKSSSSDANNFVETGGWRWDGSKTRRAFFSEKLKDNPDQRCFYFASSTDAPAARKQDDVLYTTARALPLNGVGRSISMSRVSWALETELRRSMDFIQQQRALQLTCMLLSDVRPPRLDKDDPILPSEQEKCIDMYDSNIRSAEYKMREVSEMQSAVNLFNQMPSASEAFKKEGFSEVSNGTVDTYKAQIERIYHMYPAAFGGTCPSAKSVIQLSAEKE